MAKCPYCSELIDDDSCYCDQCGGLLYVCPSCKKIGRGKGKRCGACGSPLVASTEVTGTNPAPDTSSQNSSGGNMGSSSGNQSVQNPNNNNGLSNGLGSNSSQSQSQSLSQSHSQSQSQNNQSPGVGRSMNERGCQTTDLPSQPSALEYAPMGIRLALVSGNMIGRVNGPYSSQLGQCIYISGTHARVDFDGRKWTITDLGSRNGTKVNGEKCAPTLTFKVGDTVRLGNYYDFKVV